MSGLREERDVELRTFSMTYMPPNVQVKLTAPRMIWVTNESEMPTDWKIVAPYWWSISHRTTCE